MHLKLLPFVTERGKFFPHMLLTTKLASVVKRRLPKKRLLSDETYSMSSVHLTAALEVWHTNDMFAFCDIFFIRK